MEDVFYVLWDSQLGEPYSDEAFDTLTQARNVAREIETDENIAVRVVDNHAIEYETWNVWNETIADEVEFDNVEIPKHYQLGNGKELKDVMPDLIGKDGTINAYTFNVIKYVLRWQTKNGIEDLRKAKQYIDMIIDLEDI